MKTYVVKKAKGGFRVWWKPGNFGRGLLIASYTSKAIAEARAAHENAHDAKRRKKLSKRTLSRLRSKRKK